MYQSLCVNVVVFNLYEVKLFQINFLRLRSSQSCATMAKGRHSRFPPRRSANSTVIFAGLLMFSFLILILLALGVFSIPSTSRDSPKANDLSSIVRTTSIITDGYHDRGDQWLEVISWEPRAFVYHNFLVSLERFWCTYAIICVCYLPFGMVSLCEWCNDNVHFSLEGKSVAGSKTHYPQRFSENIYVIPKYYARTYLLT